MPIFRGNAGRDTDRLEAFSDAIIAIAITLLVLDVRVPSQETIGSDRALWHALGELWPSYFGFALSFVVIGIMWINHHQIFQFIARTNQIFLAINVLFLLCVAFLPFPTGLPAEYVGHDGEKTATIVYTGFFFLTSCCYNLVWTCARKAGLMEANADPIAVAGITRAYSFGPPSYLIAFLVAFISPAASLAIMALLAILYTLPSALVLMRGRRP